jgi:catechol 2,3-dioxygenase-like lactoylglutathione lyase family enzyme
VRTLIFRHCSSQWCDGKRCRGRQPHTDSSIAPPRLHIHRIFSPWPSAGTSARSLSCAVTRAITLLATLLLTASIFLLPAPLRAQSSAVKARGIDHVAISVRDLRKSADWYAEVFGFTVLHEWNTTWMIGKREMRIGLFARPSGVAIDELDSKLAIQHFAFLCDRKEFAAAQQRLKAANILFTGPEDSGIALSIFLHDPDGHEVEITTYYKPPS